MYLAVVNFKTNPTATKTFIATTVHALKICAEDFHKLERDHHSRFYVLNRDIAIKLREHSREHGQPIRIISVTDILRWLISRPSALMTQITQAAGIKELQTMFGMI